MAQRDELIISIRGLYLHNNCRGPRVNQASLLNPPPVMGELAANNWTVYDGPGPDAKLVARAHGLHINAGNWHNSFRLVFEDGRFKGSTLQVMGVVVEHGEWAIVGGTGELAMATGEVPHHTHKIGPWGGHGGSPKDIAEPPKHLESITVMCGVVIHSVTFTYIDQTGQKHTAGPWGGSDGSPHKIQLAASEFVKEISGTYGTFDGATVITSLKVITNVQTFGPWSTEIGTPFSVPVQKGSGIVGFFARAGMYLDAIGVHVHHV
ncbi:hypothetical protein GQ55_3G417200 [Panicum hallii var. hallii]|uniref:Jacalin-type lectin domain-containing protein n=1 Tax=Panicum hallii var. hallii TaxID=1504633 RepID=A0A2T7EHB2_9POAL|nr:hypothetical protein GQ55_3G417200 [Panicum hallii var. hallii]